MTEMSANKEIVKTLFVASGIKGTHLDKLCKMNIGLDRVIEVLAHAKRNNCKVGFVITALENNWDLTPPQVKGDEASSGTHSNKERADPNCPRCHGTGVAYRSWPTETDWTSESSKRLDVKNGGRWVNVPCPCIYRKEKSGV